MCRRSPIPWPTQSLDLNPLDFGLWGPEMRGFTKKLEEKKESVWRKMAYISIFCTILAVIKLSVCSLICRINYLLIFSQKSYSVFKNNNLFWKLDYIQNLFLYLRNMNIVSSILFIFSRPEKNGLLSILFR